MLVMSAMAMYYWKMYKIHCSVIFFFTCSRNKRNSNSFKKNTTTGAWIELYRGIVLQNLRLSTFEPCTNSHVGMVFTAHSCGGVGWPILGDGWFIG